MCWWLLVRLHGNGTRFDVSWFLEWKRLVAVIRRRLADLSRPCVGGEFLCHVLSLRCVDEVALTVECCVGTMRWVFL